MTVTEPSSNKPAPQDNYIDIIDVIGFLWRAKVFVIVGVLLMMLAAIGVVNSQKPPVFISTVPVTLEVAGGISPDQIMAKFQSLVGRADVIRDLSAAGVNFVGGKAPFKLVNSSDQMILEVSSLSPDVSGDKALRAAKALAEASQKLEKAQTDGAAEVVLKKKSTSDLEIKYRKMVAGQVAEEAPFRTQLFAMEAKLAQIAGVRPIPATFTEGSSVGDDVMRLLGATESKLSVNERAKILENYAELIGNIKAIEAKYRAPLRQISMAMSVASGVLADLVKGYPVLVPNEGAYRASVAIGSHERYENTRTLFILLGVLLGGLFGVLIYGLSRFVQSNNNRLRAIFSKNH
jgi:hypothetical protein